VKALAPRVFDLHTGRVGAGYQSHLELDSRGGEPRSAEAAIQRFLELLTVLAPASRRLWNTATQRDFNIGIQAGTGPPAFELALSPSTLKAVARLGARIVLTIYAPGVSLPASRSRPSRSSRSDRGRGGGTGRTGRPGNRPPRTGRERRRRP